ncbi:TRAP transporter substrate-binding protein [Aquabacterium sp.]|uniref:TRAP transporter substrate-binding protein n=1 Tax=Aquabacterium sp. TaxID=1872578 RepID=UPI002B659120|nr:TRAP transporter substrate-binding protein [Aquabacterium sp.]HSW05902.1 TRAP transporter substrate-binding protein [Aquabacterium sp.]
MSSSDLTRRALLSLGGAAAIAGVAPARAQGTPVVMKLASATINDVIHHWMKTFKAAVEARAPGRIKVELYPASQLGAIPRMVEGTALGTIECFVTASSFLTSLDPRFEVFDVPGMIANTAHAQRVFSTPEFRQLAFGFGGAKGLEPISAFMHSPQAVVSRKPIRSIADFNTQKIRVLSTPMQIEPLRKLGASPVPMPLSEVMPALQNGAIDGFIAASTIFSALKFYDAAKFQTELPQWPIIALATCNKAWLAKLPADLRAIVQEEATKAEAPTNEFGAKDIQAAKAIWLQNGGQIIALSPEDTTAFAKLVNSTAVAILRGNAAASEAFQKFAALAQQHKA